MLNDKPYAPGDGTIAIQFRIPVELNKELDKLADGDEQQRKAFFCPRSHTSPS
jgi:hypothetical protein